MDKSVNVNIDQQLNKQSTSQMIPKKNFDYILTYKNKDYDNKFEEHKRIRECFFHNLTLEGLVLDEDKKQEITFVKISTVNENLTKDKFNVLRKYAELLRWKLPVTHKSLQKYEQEESQKQYNYFDTVRTEYKIHYYYSKEMSYLFDDTDPNFFTPAFRIVVVENILQNTRFDVRLDELSEPNTPISEESSLNGEKPKLDEFSLGIDKLIHEGVFTDKFPLHDGHYSDEKCIRGQLMSEWASIWHWSGFQPLDKIKQYFGAQVALYFAWLGFYTHMLIPASIIGIVCLLWGLAAMKTSPLSNEICDENNEILICPQCDKTCNYWKLQDTCTYAKITNFFDNDFTVFFAMTMCIWTTLLLEFWKRYSAYLVHNWGLTDYTKRVEPKRPKYLEFLFKNGNSEKISCSKSPPRPVRYVFSYSVSILAISLILITTFGVIIYRMSLNAAKAVDNFIILKDTIGYNITVLPAIGAVINLIAIKILNYFYYYAAQFLTEQELHRTQTEYDESFGLKIYLFQFFNYYSSIFYIALLKGKFVGFPGKYRRIFGYRQEECGPTGCMLELFIQLATIMVGKQILYSIQEILWDPFWNLIFKVIDKIKRWIYNIKEEKSSDQWFKDYKLTSFTYMTLFGEYLEIVMQFGFVTIFVVAFPLAPFFALLNNIFELRWDAHKFLKYYRKPITKRARNIGVWMNIMEIICRLSVFINAAIIAFSSNFIPLIVFKLLPKSNDNHPNTYLNFTLTQFNTSNFERGTHPEYSTYNNTEVCYYPAFRIVDEEDYKLTPSYWYVLVGKLAFIVVFQNIVGFIQLFVDYAIPDKPRRLKDRIRHEESLITEIVNEGKFPKAGKKFSCVVDQLRTRNKNSEVNDVLFNISQDDENTKI